MVLNYIWVAFFLIAFVVAIAKLIYSYYLSSNSEILGVSQELIDKNRHVFGDIVNAVFERAELGFELSIGLTGILALWLGIMKIGEQGGAIKILSKLVGPLFTSIFPNVPKNHPASGSIVMNFCANMLGLDNAATPLGLKAMDQLQALNPKKDTASNEQIMFLVLNTSGLTIIPVSILALRTSAGSADPTSVFLPILIATYFSTLAGLITVSIIQKINLFKWIILAYVGGGTVLMALLIWFLGGLDQAALGQFSKIASSALIFSIIISFLLLAIRKKVNVYEAFIEGAKEGFNVAIKIVPYLIAMLVGIGAFTASGAMGWLIDGFAWCIASIGLDTSFVDALPTALMKPLSGGGARAMMVESWGAESSLVDSFTGKLTSILQGSTETTFYVLAVYFGSVGIKKTRYAVKAGLIADLIGIITAIILGYLFFGSPDSEGKIDTKDGIAKALSIDLSNNQFDTFNGVNLTDYAQYELDFGEYIKEKTAHNGQFLIDSVYFDGTGFILETMYRDNRSYYSKGIKQKYQLTIKHGELKSVFYFGNLRLEKAIIDLNEKEHFQLNQGQ